MRKIDFIGGCVDVSLWSISIVYFKSFRFSKEFKRFGLKKKLRNFHVIKFII